jgi:hypothetical protein
MQRGFDPQRKTGGGGRPALMASQQVERTAELQDPGGPGGIGLAHPQVRAGVFCRWPARLDSAGECACKATGHARAG